MDLNEVHYKLAIAIETLSLMESNAVVDGVIDQLQQAKELLG